MLPNINIKCFILSCEIISAAIEVHRCTGPGMLESVYEQCLCVELGKRDIGFERQVRIPVNYKGCMINCGYRMDLLVDDLCIPDEATGWVDGKHHNGS